jgi:hypothetical protein
MSNRLSDAMSKLNVDSARNSYARPNSTVKRQSGLDPSTINAMFPDAAAAIATEKAKYTQHTGNNPPSNRNSTAVENPRSSLAAPTLAAPNESLENAAALTQPWGAGDAASRPKSSSSGQAPMGQFVQPPPSAGLRSPRPLVAGGAIQNTTLTTSDKLGGDGLPLLSPYAGGGNWSSMVNTPMAPTFNANQSAANQADMVANATAMKLAALSTVNNRFALDDVRKYRRARSNDAAGGQNMSSLNAQAANIAGTNVVMINEHGQVLNPNQVIALQNQQAALGFGGQRSRPSSPGIAMQGGFAPAMTFTSPQNNGFLSAYDGASGLANNGLGNIGLGPFGAMGADAYQSDHSEMRGRSPRGRRGSSKPPEDPTDPTLLQDIPSWLRSLRLHKYTDNLKDMNWEQLVELDDAALEARGVNALGARRKMLKVFEQVKGTQMTLKPGD